MVSSELEQVAMKAAGLRRLIDRVGITRVRGRAPRIPDEYHREWRNREMPEQLVGTVDELGPGSVRGIGDWAVLNVNGERHAVSRRCRHLRADLANGKIDEDGCLVCPWHQSRYDATTGRMVVGPQAGFEKVPGLDTAFIQLTKLWPLRRAEVVERDGNVYVRT